MLVMLVPCFYPLGNETNTVDIVGKFLSQVKAGSPVGRVFTILGNCHSEP